MPLLVPSLRLLSLSLLLLLRAAATALLVLAPAPPAAAMLVLALPATALLVLALVALLVLALLVLDLLVLALLVLALLVLALVAWVRDALLLELVLRHTALTSISGGAGAGGQGGLVRLPDHSSLALLKNLNFCNRPTTALFRNHCYVTATKNQQLGGGDILFVP